MREQGISTTPAAHGRKRKMRLRPYNGKIDYEYLEHWVNDERIHVLWCARLLPWPLTREALDAFLERDAREWGGFAYVATEDDGKPIGFFLYSTNVKENSGFLKFIVLDPELRGRGYGVRMIKLALKYAFEITGVTSVQLNVFQVNAAAVRCYEKAGLKVRAVEENAFRYREEIWARCNMVIVRS